MAVEVPWRMLFTLRDLGACAQAGLSRAAVRVESGPQFARAPHRTDGSIEREWAARLAANSRLFDGAKYRLASAHATPGEAAGCCLTIGPTSYREYVGTHLIAETHATLVADGADGAAADACAHLSCALGVETVLVTADRHVVLLRRSHAVATSAGQYNGPSGHPEPDAARGGLGALEDAAAVRDQIFDAVLAETVEETGAPRAALGEPRLIGAMADGTRKPDLLFVTPTRLTAQQMLALFREGAPSDAWESSGMIAVPPCDGSPSGWDCAALGVQLTAVTQAAMACMQVRRELLREAGLEDDLTQWSPS
jgi:hypothetical protein